MELMESHQQICGTLLLPDGAKRGVIRQVRNRIASVEILDPADPVPTDTRVWPGLIAPGFFDLHVHGGSGHDFMDGTREAFEAVCKAHARHGTTRLLATSTVAPDPLIRRFLDMAAQLIDVPTGGARLAGVHLYGPFFAPAAKGCHPSEGLVAPQKCDFETMLDARFVRTASVAPELLGAESFAIACRRKGVRLNLGHSHATFDQVERAVGWGARHVDHLFCAMSDRARLRLEQTYPMRGGLMEATLCLDALTTEIIADGRHLADELLRLAFKVKGPDRLALVTDAMRGMDMPDGHYVFGPKELNELVLKSNGVGLTLDGKALASAVAGMDEGFRNMVRATGAPLHVVAGMASLTPARIAGLDAEMGSLSVGKRADFVLMNDALQVCETWVDGAQVYAA
jgi:N-acetylglucosamine-6-phosphate deacetylase